MRYLLYILITVTAFGCSNYQKVLKDGTPKEKLEAAKKFYQNKDYIRALPLLDELRGLYYGKKELEEIYYSFAYSHYGNAEYMQAGYHFNYFAVTFALSPKKRRGYLYVCIMQIQKIYAI